MIPPRNPYVKFVCGACGWSVIYKQHSDVIFVPMQCERCGSGDLKTQAANALEQMAHENKQLLKLNNHQLELVVFLVCRVPRLYFTQSQTKGNIL